MRIIKYYIIFFLFIFFLNGISLAQKNTIDCSRIAKLIYLLDKFHYQPLQLNKNNTGLILEDFFDQIDPYGFFLTKKDIESLPDTPTELSSEPSDHLSKFLEEVTLLYETKLKEVDSLTGEILASPFNLTIKDSLTIRKDYKPIRVGNEGELKEQLKNWLQYRIVHGLYMSGDSSSSNSKSTFVFKDINKKEAEFREKLLTKERKKINNFLADENDLKDYILSTFLDAIANSYDPHSSYFTPQENKSFLKGISTDEYSFGIMLGENDNEEVIIQKLVPGGPAWKSKELFSGDKIIKIKWPDNKPIDLSFADIDETESALYLSDAKTIDITVRNSNGQIKTVTLKKEKMAIDENKVKSYILKGDKKIGYISLPGFYTDMLESSSSQGCANDVAKEILKLKNDGIDGLVLDIRNNGGGSMDEVLELAGIFIDEGTLLLLKDKGEPAYSLKDKNRGTVYDGPLEVMVNAGSASASEVLAAILQDYHRAVIIGSPTFGKATAQVIVPLDTAVNSKIRNDNLSTKDGYLKLTVEKIFRLNCKSYQKTGVIPDVFIPGIYNGMEFRESSYYNALSKDSIVKKVFFSPLPPLPLKEISDKSKERIANDEKFKEIIRLNDSLKKSDKKTAVFYADTASFLAQENMNKGFLNKSEKLVTEKTNDFQTVNNDSDDELYKMDLYRKGINDDFLNQIQKDIYIDESYKIMIDLINFEAHK
jgi:carboxyl-terminal processing protease